MKSKELKTIAKKFYESKFFVPVLVAVIIIIGGLWLESSRNGNKTASDGTEVPAIVDIQNKKDIKTLVFGQKEFDLNYAGLDASAVDNVSSFESKDGWQGTGVLDFTNHYEGESSLSVTSNDSKSGIIYLDKTLNLSDFKTFEFFMSINDVSTLESAVVKVGDASMANYYSYAISNFIQGWKLIKIPQDQFVLHAADPAFGWKDIKKIQLEIVSRPNSLAMANFDYLTVQKNNDYLQQWKTLDDNFLSLGKIGGKAALMARNEGASQAILKDVSGDNFTYQASFVPQKPGALGLFFRGNYGNNKGYYFLSDGLGKSSVFLAKSGVKGWTVLKTVEVSNFVFEKDTKYWLRVKTQGNTLTGYISTNGTDFTELLSVSDDEFASGGVGIAAYSRTYGFFDDFKFN